MDSTASGPDTPTRLETCIGSFRGRPSHFRLISIRTGWLVGRGGGRSWAGQVVKWGVRAGQLRERANLAGKQLIKQSGWR